MPKFIKISNNTELDVPVAVSMIGASVKTSEDAIGQFGSGLKYAFAQAARENIDISIVSGGIKFVLQTRNKQFRSTDFEQVILKAGNKVYDTPMTTEMGKYDWNDKWFIFREIICNAMDEGEYSIEITNCINTQECGTSFYLPYETFSYIYNDMENYIYTKNEKGMLEYITEGTGRAFNKKIYVGNILEDGKTALTYDFHSTDLTISESRQIDHYSTYRDIGYCMSVCVHSEDWKLFLSQPTKHLEEIPMTIYNENVMNAMWKALQEMYGDNVIICPDFDNAVKDIVAMGMIPFVIPARWEIKKKYDFMKYWDDVLSWDACIEDIVTPTDDEATMLERVVEKVKEFGIYHEAEIHIIDGTDSQLLGLAEKSNKKILLQRKLFQDETKLTAAYIHEIGHLVTKQPDYSRAFVDFFVNSIANSITK